MDEMKRILINAGLLKDVEILIEEYTKKDEPIEEESKSIELGENGSNYNEWIVENMEDKYLEDYQNFMNELDEPVDKEFKKPVFGKKSAFIDQSIRDDVVGLYKDLVDMLPDDSNEEDIKKAAAKYEIDPRTLKNHLDLSGFPTGGKQRPIQKDELDLYNEENEQDDVPTPSLDELKKTLKYKS